ncbi:D-hexose-6-phosphate mutarotase [Sulfurimonas sp.]
MYTLKRLKNGFKYIEIKNDVMQAKIALQGAHIFEFNKLLWLSEISKFQEGVAIRGGIPLCWPRFGSLDVKLPQHGFARTQMFELVKVEEINNRLTTVHMLLKDNKETREIWDYTFELHLVFNLGESLSISLRTDNTGTKDFMITQALHSYFSISDIKNISIEGLQNRYYHDALSEKKVLQKGTIKICQEVDRVYEGVDKDIVLQDGQRKVHLRTKNSASAIVWNPWIEKTKKMSAMKRDAYKKFVCIESANAFDDFKTIQAGDSYILKLEIQESENG